MTPNATTSIIAGAVARARREIAAHFFVHHATSAEDAVAFVPQRLIVRRQFEKLQARGVIRDAGGGKYWIDTAAYQADIDRRRAILVPVVVVLVLIAAAAIAWFGYRG